MEATTAQPKGYMLMFNISKQKNFGTILRSAAAFGLSSVFMVDANHKKLSKFGSQGTADKMDYTVFATLQDVKKYCNANKIAICGVEIIEGAKPIHEMPFTGDTVFMLGNEGSGLNEKQIEICD